MRVAPAIILAACVALAGCELAPDENLVAPPRVRLVNAAPASTAVNVYLDNATQGMTADALVFKSGSDCLFITEAAHTFKFAQSSGTLGSVTGTVERGKSYTVLLVGSGSTFRALFLPDNQAAPAGSNGLRFINSTSSAGDVYVTATDGTPTAGTRAAGNMGILALTNEQPAFVFRPDGDTRVRLYDVGTTTTARADLNLALLPLSRLAYIIFIEKTVGTDPGALQYNACS